MKLLYLIPIVLLTACSVDAPGAVEQWCEQAREAARQVADAPAGTDIYTLEAVRAMAETTPSDTTRLTDADRIMIRETNEVLVDAIAKHVAKGNPALTSEQLETGRRLSLSHLNSVADTASTLGSYLRTVDRP